MEIASGLIKLKPNTEEQIELWRETLTQRLDEALETLKHEGVEIESWFQITIEGQEYLLWYMRAESIQKAFEAARTFKHPIDKFHFELLESITAENGLVMARPLYDPKLLAEQAD